MTAAFEREWIDYMVNNRYDSVTAVKYLFISIDPAACKDLNCYVLTSMFFINGICVVCFAAAAAAAAVVLYHVSCQPYTHTLVNHLQYSQAVAKEEVVDDGTRFGHESSNLVD
jgi:hypothetical protein